MQQASLLNYPAVTHPSLTPCSKHPHRKMQVSSLTFPISHLWIQTVSLLQIHSSKACGTRAIISSLNVQIKPCSCVRAYSWPRTLCIPPHPGETGAHQRNKNTQWGGERTPHSPSSIPTQGDLLQDLITRISTEKKEQTPKRKENDRWKNKAKRERMKKCQFLNLGMNNHYSQKSGDSVLLWD